MCAYFLLEYICIILHIYIYIYNEIEKRENNHFTFHFSGINILASKNLKR